MSWNDCFFKLPTNLWTLLEYLFNHIRKNKRNVYNRIYQFVLFSCQINTALKQKVPHMIRLQSFMRKFVVSVSMLDNTYVCDLIFFCWRKFPSLKNISCNFSIWVHKMPWPLVRKFFGFEYFFHEKKLLLEYFPWLRVIFWKVWNSKRNCFQNLSWPEKLYYFESLKFRVGGRMCMTIRS